MAPPMQTSYAVQPNHILDHSAPTDPNSRRCPRLTGYRITNVLLALVFVIVKGVLAFNNMATLANASDLLMGVFCGVALYFIGFLEEMNVPCLYWFFHRDYTCSLFLPRQRRSPSVDVEVPNTERASTYLSSRLDTSLVITKALDTQDVSGLRRRIRHPKRAKDLPELEEVLGHHRDTLVPAVTGSSDRLATLSNDDGSASSNRTSREVTTTQLERHNNHTRKSSNRSRGTKGRVALEERISNLRAALEQLRFAYPRHHLHLNQLATSLLHRFEMVGDYVDLDDAVLYCRRALEETPWGHPDRVVNLNNLASVLQTRFEHCRDANDLEDAIIHFNGALEFNSALEFEPSDSTLLFFTHTSLGHALLSRFEHARRHEDLDQAMALYHRAHGLAYSGHPDLAMSLNNVANAYLTRFDAFKNPLDLEEAIANNRVALELTPEGHGDRHISLDNLATALLVRFDESKDPASLEEAVSSHRRALEQTPEGHPDRFRSYSSLANSLLARFEAVGDRIDLDECIRNHRCAVQLMPDDHFDYPSNLQNLASALLVRFEHFTDPNDLEDAYSHYQNAIDSLPSGSLFSSAPTSFNPSDPGRHEEDYVDQRAQKRSGAPRSVSLALSQDADLAGHYDSLPPLPESPFQLHSDPVIVVEADTPSEFIDLTGSTEAQRREENFDSLEIYPVASEFPATTLSTVVPEDESTADHPLTFSVDDTDSKKEFRRSQYVSRPSSACDNPLISRSGSASVDASLLFALFPETVSAADSQGSRRSSVSTISTSSDESRAADDFKSLESTQQSRRLSHPHSFSTPLTFISSGTPFLGSTSQEEEGDDGPANGFAHVPVSPDAVTASSEAEGARMHDEKAEDCKPCNIDTTDELREPKLVLSCAQTPLPVKRPPSSYRDLTAKSSGNNLPILEPHRQLGAGKQRSSRALPPPLSTNVILSAEGAYQHRLTLKRGSAAAPISPTSMTSNTGMRHWMPTPTHGRLSSYSTLGRDSSADVSTSAIPNPLYPNSHNNSKAIQSFSAPQDIPAEDDEPVADVPHQAVFVGITDFEPKDLETKVTRPSLTRALSRTNKLQRKSSTATSLWTDDGSKSIPNPRESPFLTPHPHFHAPPPLHNKPHNSLGRSNSKSTSFTLSNAESETTFAPEVSHRTSTDHLIPPEWIYPLELTLEQLFKGGKYDFRITTRLLSGERRTANLEIDIKPGWKSGSRVIFPGAGNERMPGAFQDLIFVIKQAHHERFTRLDMGKLVLDHDISLEDALNDDGPRHALCRIRGIDGKTIQFAAPMGVIQPGQETILKGHGMYVRSKSEIVGRGDLVIRWNVIMPSQVAQLPLDRLRKRRHVRQ